MKLTTIILIILVPMLSFCSPQPQKPTGTKKSPITADPDKDNIVDDQDNDLNGNFHLPTLIIMAMAPTTALTPMNHF